MSYVILGLLFVIMLTVSLRSIHKPTPLPHIDEVIGRETPRQGWGVLPWLLALIAVIFILRVFFG
jgi:hypothetical protein